MESLEVVGTVVKHVISNSELETTNFSIINIYLFLLRLEILNSTILKSILIS